MRYSHRPFYALLVVYFVLGALYAIRTPAWQSPDEPAHYRYIEQLSAIGCCPIITGDDWDQVYIVELTSNEFAPRLLDRLYLLAYEDHQPPLYYLLALPVFAVTDGNLIAVRLFSVLIGAGVVACAYAVGRSIAPERPAFALGGAAVVALIPQHLAILASVNNDALSELVVGLALLLSVQIVLGHLRTSAQRAVSWIAIAVALVVLPISIGLGGTAHALAAALLLAAGIGHFGLWARAPRFPLAFDAWTLGLIVGIGLITKVNTLFLIGVAGFALFIRWVAWPRLFPAALSTAVISTDNTPDEAAEVAEVVDDTVVEEATASRSNLVLQLIMLALPILLIGGVWMWRNAGLYGIPDVFGLARHNQVVADQPRTAETIEAIGVSDYLQAATTTTFNSFWGQFGWMARPLPSWAYTAIIAFLLLTLIGLIVRARNRRFFSPPHETRWTAWAVLGVAALGAIAQYIYYNLEFYQVQGRYLFPLLIPFSLWIALGWEGWSRVLVRVGIGNRAAAWLAVVPTLVLLVPLNLFVLVRELPQLLP